MKKSVLGMEWKDILGIIIIIIGLLILITQPFSPTGAVIDLTTAVSRVWFFIGLGMIITGILTFYTGWRTHKTNMPIEDIIEYGRDNDTVFILDTSGILAYKPNLSKLIKSAEGRVYVPKRVISELEKNPKNKGLVNYLLNQKGVRRINPKGTRDIYRKTRKTARENLETSKKHKDYLNFKYIIENNEKPKGMHEEDYEEYKKRIEEEIIPRLREQPNKSKREPTKENKIWYLKKHYRVNKGDIDVLTTALLTAKYGKKPKIVAEDTHLRSAVERIKLKNRPIGSVLDYIEYAKHENKYERV